MRTVTDVEDFEMTNRFDPTAANVLSAADRALLERRRATLGDIYPLFYERPLHVTHGAGTRLVDADGVEYLDAYNNVPAVGHANERVVDAVATQLRRMNTHTRYLQDGIVDFAERFLATYPADLDHVVFTNSGSEANDLALQIARWRTKSRGIIVTERAYHGTTALLAGVSPENGLSVPLHDFVRAVEPPDTHRHGERAGEVFAEAVADAVADLVRAGHGISALLVDTILSTDGIFPGEPGLLNAAFAIVRASGGLIVADEVQPGMGRLGHGMWGFTRHTTDVDMVTSGKPLAGGLPIGSLVLSASLSDGYAEHHRYFNTFGGNPASIAAATAVLDEVQERGLTAHAARTGARLQRLIADAPESRDLVADVRGAGLFIGVEMADTDDRTAAEMAAAVVNGLRERRVLISAVGRTGQVLKIRPPLVFADHDVDEFVAAYRSVLDDLRESLEGSSSCAHSEGTHP